MKPKTYLNWTEDHSNKIEEILVDLGYQLSDRGNYWQSTAAYRDGDNRTALQIWKDTGVWRDFVQGTTYQPLKKLIELSCVDDDRISEILDSLEDKNDSFIPSIKAPKMEIEQFFTHEDIGTLLPHYKFYNDKGISEKTLSIYKSGFSMSGKMNGRYVFPVYDSNGKIIGQSGRHLLWKPSSNFSKWKHIGRKGKWIYPLNMPDNSELFLQDIESKKEIILVEGIGDSLALTEQKVFNHMVTFGLDISPKQLSYLVSLNLDKITIAMNNDGGKQKNRGKDAAIKILLKLIKYFDIEKVEIKLPILNDFGEMLENQIPIDDWLNKKINRIKQISYILNDHYGVKDKKCVKILKDFLEKLNFEANSIS